jgi:predicted nuclease of restriction endonuclease-like (RecB) superfamily
MSARKNMNNYPTLLKEVKDRIRRAQIRATMSANAEMLLMYWDVGRILDRRQASEGWGAGVIPRLSKDIRNELPEIKGFSERNLKRMLAFYREYTWLVIVPPAVAQLEESGEKTFVPQSVAQMTKEGALTSTAAMSLPEQHLIEGLQRLVPLIPWGHAFMLIEKVKALPERLWYMQHTLTEGWSRYTLEAKIKAKVYDRQGKATTNFSTHLPSPQSALAQEALKDPYIFDFLTLEEPFHERELETGLIGHVEKFLLELGAGFAFVGRQYHLEVSDQDFYIDLLFYHTKLRCYVVIELKKGKFKPEYAGKVNFYCSVVDDVLRHEQDNPTIGLILCQSHDRVVAEYTLRGINKPIGVSEYELTRALPDSLKSSLPTVEEIEERLEEKP